MNTREARDLGRDLAELVGHGRSDAAHARLLPLLQSRTPFRLLDLIGQAIGTGAMEPANAFAERVAADGTEGGWVVAAGILREQLARDMPGACERARAFIARGNAWYVADILGERVPGPSLLLDFEQALDCLVPWRIDPDRWVRRTVGVAVHFWAKRAHEDAARREETGRLLVFLEPMFEERDVDAAKGVGWGLKTVGKYYPDLLLEWLLRQTDRRPSRLMLSKALTYLPADQQARLLEAFGR